jgi:hypothetical protein
LRNTISSLGHLDFSLLLEEWLLMWPLAGDAGAAASYMAAKSADNVDI